ncbi:MAG: deoxyribonuclease IV [Desulfofustis sp.]|nr:deoxyribonuclease IV [Desulfofustis sp.]NNK13477.1 deoxyribonuclease IV [Desulfofustis sp.]
MPYLGAHESVGKGLHFAFDRIAQVGGESLQIFTRNQRQWNPKPLNEAEIDLFRAAKQKHNDMIVASHGSYLINLASGKVELRHKSILSFVGELQRCHDLGIPYIVIHPGTHGGDGVEAGLIQFVNALDEAIERAESQSMVLLETTAGQGTSLGSRFEELAWIRENSRCAEKIGFCLDTCHIFAAGYDIRSEESYNQTFNDFDRLIGLQHLHFFHLNDSKKELGSRVDRHEHIGQGCIGLQGFRNLLNDARFAAHPMTLETPKGEDLKEDIENLATLRGLQENSP